MTTHELSRGAFTKEGHRIVAECVCGWKSLPVANYRLANALFAKHVAIRAAIEGKERP